ncbi:pollen-specific leucine-rich repeat extensin-like protein 1 [Silurus meridionalis]|nr:pollen-specific leucine-rich repeat extensin-like protein 1 [Silurus meridionalis]
MRCVNVISRVGRECDQPAGCECDQGVNVISRARTFWRQGEGTVLAPFLFTVYTADFMFSSATCHLQKFSDDSAIVSLITNDADREYRGLIQNFVDWCQRSRLQINVGKTKELVVNFRRHKQTSLPSVNIQGKEIVRVDSYKYFGDGAGVAVPTPTVPVLPSYTTPQISHTGNTERLSNGSAISSDDIEDGQILIPPPPTIAPPPPPPQFIPPSPGYSSTPSAFFEETYLPVDLSTLQPPSMPPPKPPSLGTPEDVNLSALRPPPMAPPKPPSYQMSTNSPEDIPECPKFTPPLPPTEKVNGNEKETNIPQNLVPPVKPVRRNSSGIKLDDNIHDLKENMQAMLPNQSLTPVRVVDSMASTLQTPPDVPNKIVTPKKNSATAEKPTTVLSAQDIINFTPPDPMQRYSPLLNKKLQNLKTNEPSNGKEATTSPLALLLAAKEREKQKAALSRENSTKSNTSIDSTTGGIQMSNTRSNTFTVTPKPTASSGSIHPYTEIKPNTESPKIPDSSSEHSASSSSTLFKSPASILSPSSPSDQYNSFNTVSFIPPPPEFANSDPEDEAPPNMLPPDPPAKRTDIIASPNAAPITNGPANSPSIKSYSINTPMNAVPKTQFKRASPPKLQPQAPPPSPLKLQPPAAPTSVAKLQPQAPPTSPPKFQPQAPPTSPPKFQPQAPPTSPPKFQPQAPPTSPPKFQPQAPPTSPPKFQPQAPPTSPPKFQPHPPPSPPKFQPQVPSPLKFQPQAPSPSLLKTPPHAPPTASANQATLLSILQKKMLEMDPKFTLAREPDTGGDEWSTPSFDEDVGGSASLNSTPKPKSSTVPVQSAGLDIKELENKVSKKAQAKAPASSAPSKQQFGMTFMVRPGTKQPITPIPKTE